ncbi:protein of unknown function [Cyanobium sp. NIES-981]|nr:protein of unknown function [Cyanobium sp. NIES-981]
MDFVWSIGYVYCKGYLEQSEYNALDTGTVL